MVGSILTICVHYSELVEGGGSKLSLGSVGLDGCWPAGGLVAMASGYLR